MIKGFVHMFLEKEKVMPHASAGIWWSERNGSILEGHKRSNGCNSLKSTIVDGATHAATYAAAGNYQFDSGGSTSDNEIPLV